MSKDADQPEHAAACSVDPNTILRAKEVLRLIGVSRSTLWRLWNRGEFPRARKITNRLIGWRAGEVIAWLNSREIVGSGVGESESALANGNQPRRASTLTRGGDDTEGNR